MSLKQTLIRTFFLFLFLSLCYLCGNAAAHLIHTRTFTTLSTHLLEDSLSWGLSFPQDGQRPVGTSSMEDLEAYHAYYAQDTEEKVLYLTFDCGYENGNTETILDALNKHQAPAAFFVVGNYLSTSPDLVKRMIKEGHIIGNHSYHHPDMTQLTAKDAFAEELEELSALCYEVTGEKPSPYYRPPQGRYSDQTLKMADELGYCTIFWSLAYVDWYENDQPSPEEAFQKLVGRIHPGAVVLLHNTSSTNAAILDELLGKWEDMGYRFGTLEELTTQKP